jgi:hypothetical protein
MLDPLRAQAWCADAASSFAYAPSRKQAGERGAHLRVVRDLPRRLLYGWVPRRVYSLAAVGLSGRSEDLPRVKVAEPINDCTRIFT